MIEKSWQQEKIMECQWCVHGGDVGGKSSSLKIGTGGGECERRAGAQRSKEGATRTAGGGGKDEAKWQTYGDNLIFSKDVFVDLIVARGAAHDWTV